MKAIMDILVLTKATWDKIIMRVFNYVYDSTMEVSGCMNDDTNTNWSDFESKI